MHIHVCFHVSILWSGHQRTKASLYTQQISTGEHKTHTHTHYTHTSAGLLDIRLWICQRSCHNHIKDTRSRTHTCRLSIKIDCSGDWYKRIFDMLIMQWDERVPQHGPNGGQDVLQRAPFTPIHHTIPLVFASLHKFNSLALEWIYHAFIWFHPSSSQLDFTFSFDHFLQPTIQFSSTLSLIVRKIFYHKHKLIINHLNWITM